MDLALDVCYCSDQSTVVDLRYGAPPCERGGGDLTGRLAGAPGPRPPATHFRETPSGTILSASFSHTLGDSVDRKEVDRKQLEKERKASLERRRRQLEEAAKERLESERTDTRTLSRAERIKLREDEFVPPED